MAVPSGVQQMGGDASNVVKALAGELVDFILGADKRVRDQERSTGLVVDEAAAKNDLLAEVAAKISAVVPNANAPKHDAPKAAEPAKR